MLGSASDIALSIVIPSHSRPDLLRLCLQSIFRQPPRSLEIIVVDDGSRGGAVSAAALDFAGVQTVRLARRQGFCVAANRGMLAARGQIIQILNDDTQVERGWTEPVLDCFADPAVGAVAPLVLQGQPRSPDPTIDSAGDGYDPGGFAWKIGHGKRLAEVQLHSAAVASASGAGAFYRRQALERTGLFPEHFGAYFEDVDLALRIRGAGYEIRFEPRSRIWHLCGSSYGRQGRQLIERQSRNEEWLFWRNFDRKRAWPVLVRHAAVIAAKMVRRTREGTLLPFLAGRMMASMRLRQLLMNKDHGSCPTLSSPGPC